ncbi:gas vesicle protein GvpG [Micromonospora sp. NPDC094482]|uniref:gas vesicle protein GvpG n=1 Tax=unclassified Micromonospora TaxID=2617518 RepID=UPI0033185ADF
MDILGTLLTLPYAPVRGLTAVVKVIAREAESQLYNPANIRRELEALDAAAAAGELTAEERDQRQQQVLARLTGGTARPAAATGSPEPGPATADAGPARYDGPAGGAGRAGAGTRRGAVVRRRGDEPRDRSRTARPGAERNGRPGGRGRGEAGGGVRDDGSDPRRRRPDAPA